MARQELRIGAFANDHATADPIRTSFDKINDMTAELYAFASDTISAGWEEFAVGATVEARIALAEAACVSQGKSLLHIPLSMLPYDITLCPATASVRRFREGGEASVYDVRAYGADPTGVISASASVQAAWNASAANLGVSFIPQGRFRQTTELHVPSDLECAGAGAGSILFFDWFDSSGAGSGGDVYIENVDTTNGNFRIRLHDFAIEGSNTTGLPTGTPANGAAGGINLRRGADVDIARLRITKVPGISISYQGVSQARFIGNYISQGGHDGITGGPFGSSPCADIVIANNTIREIGDDGIAVNASVDQVQYGTTRPTRISITGNTIFTQTAAGFPNAAGRGILLNGVENFTISGNVIADTFASGIHLQADAALSGFTCRTGTITGNTITRAGQTGDGTQPQNGIWILGTTDLTVTGNTVTEAKGKGIAITDNTQAAQQTIGVVISGNTVVGCGVAITDWAIDATAGLGGGIVHTLITGNRVHNNFGGGINIQAANHTLVQGNHVTNNCRAGGATSSHAGITIMSVASGLAISILDNYVTDTQSSKTQHFGINVRTHATPWNTVVIKNNYLRGNITAECDINTMPTFLVFQRDDPTQLITAAASITPAAHKGEYVEVSALGAACLVNAPTQAFKGARLMFRFLQDGTGGRNVTWNAVFKTNWTNTGNTLGLRSTMEFEYDGTNWNQIGGQNVWL